MIMDRWGTAFTVHVVQRVSAYHATCAEQVPPSAVCPECRQRNVFQGAIELKKLGETIANRCGALLQRGV